MIILIKCVFEEFCLMNLNLTEVLLADGVVITKEVPIELDELAYGFGTFPITEKEPAKITVRKDEMNFLNIHGSAAITAAVPCDRCLEDVPVTIRLDFDERVPADGAETAGAAGADADGVFDEESAFDKEYYIQGYNLDVDKLIFGEALLNWPSQVLCKEDCRGLCPVCGQNLNHGECGCDRNLLDPRMAKVLDVFSKLKKEV